MNDRKILARVLDIGVWAFIIAFLVWIMWP